MAACSCVTAVTTVTRKRYIPPLRVAQIVCAAGGTLSRNTAGGGYLRKWLQRLLR
jgi:hypothetical protein